MSDCIWNSMKEDYENTLKNLDEKLEIFIPILKETFRQFIELDDLRKQVEKKLNCLEEVRCKEESDN